MCELDSALEDPKYVNFRGQEIDCSDTNKTRKIKVCDACGFTLNRLCDAVRVGRRSFITTMKNHDYWEGT